MPAFLKRFFIAISLLFFLVICWRLLTNTSSNPKSVDVPAAAFIQSFESGNVQKVSIYMGYKVADLKFTTKDHSTVDTTTVTTQGLPNLIKKMIDNGVSVEFAQARKADTAEIFMNILPIVMLFLLVAYFYFIRRRKPA